ncbi:alpha/beta hydrolase [Novosphingobium resinovorum]|uniref:alpha/beta hydrolase n=1 Tax=Novosphingobium TaxID=165696 RepID=UPI001B3C6B33|nr:MULTISPECIES: alpha/beta hydrolase [Novosphingobium]MBF7013837.1 alpha/beta hydrolase [Novosphingobium sp. HR1a]WJM25981.1 alpha/beta hydrolase [Novosphingobium resinovorum]
MKTFAYASCLASVLGLATMPCLAQSLASVDAPPPASPPKVTAAPATAAADMQMVLDKFMALGAKPIETLTPLKARLQPSVADAAKAVMREKGMSTAPDSTVTTKDVPYGDDPMQFARIYRPANAGTATLPVIVYYHGGGWVIADVNTYDATPRFLSKQLNAIVVSVEYRHAPEFKFPAQHDDAAMAYRWVLQNAASWGGDAGRIVLAGESAGGNLAVATAIRARDEGLALPVHILSVYPIANSSMTLPSRTDSANAKPLNAAMLKWFGHYYSASQADQQDPRINLVAALLKGLPPVTVINAQIDPLRSDGETLASAFKAAGVTVDQRTFPGVTHEFFGMGQIVRGAWEAETYAVKKLKSALAD